MDLSVNSSFRSPIIELVPLQGPPQTQPPSHYCNDWEEVLFRFIPQNVSVQWVYSNRFPQATFTAPFLTKKNLQLQLPPNWTVNEDCQADPKRFTVIMSDPD
ncbi:MAG: hypothetical protein S4CHLAM6_16020 [Chlamydiae bacterium]|nr:hypothetical protein [Chlamydiota bacterium]